MFMNKMTAAVLAITLISLSAYSWSKQDRNTTNRLQVQETMNDAIMTDVMR